MLRGLHYFGRGIRGVKRLQQCFDLGCTICLGVGLTGCRNREQGYEQENANMFHESTIRQRKAGHKARRSPTGRYKTARPPYQDQINGSDESIKANLLYVVQTRYAFGAWATTYAGMLGGEGGCVADGFAMGDDLVLYKIAKRHHAFGLAQFLRIGKENRDFA